MVEFLTTTIASSEIEKLVKNSKDKLYLISPYIQINKLLKPKLEDLDKSVSTIDIKIICRTDKINADDMAFLQKLKNVKIFALDNLHAKCYINQDTAIITSLNLYDFSQQNNIEMGVKIDKNIDPSLYDEIYKEIASIIGQSKKYDSSMAKRDSPKFDAEEAFNKSPSKGYCIRCRREIVFNPDRPLCNTCYRSWAEYSEPNYPEKYCHVCGRETNQSYIKPICYSCYQKLKF